MVQKSMLDERNMNNSIFVSSAPLFSFSTTSHLEFLPTSNFEKSLPDKPFYLWFYGKASNAMDQICSQSGHQRLSSALSYLLMFRRVMLVQLYKKLGIKWGM